MSTWGSRNGKKKGGSLPLGSNLANLIGRIGTSTQARLHHLLQPPHLFWIPTAFAHHGGLMQPRRKNIEYAGWRMVPANGGFRRPATWSLLPLVTQDTVATSEERDCGVDEMVYEGDNRHWCFPATTDHRRAFLGPETSDQVSFDHASLLILSPSLSRVYVCKCKVKLGQPWWLPPPAATSLWPATSKLILPGYLFHIEVSDGLHAFCMALNWIVKLLKSWEKPKNTTTITTIIWGLPPLDSTTITATGHHLWRLWLVPFYQNFRWLECLDDNLISEWCVIMHEIMKSRNLNSYSDLVDLFWKNRSWSGHFI